MKARILVVALIVLGFFVVFRKEYAPKENREKVPAPFSQETQRESTATLSVGTYRFRVEVADTDEKRVLGLGGRDTLAGESGMLFAFSRPDFHGIWMKGMRFSIDILWLDERFKVVDIKEHVAPETYPQAFHPKVPAYYVLEISAGAVAKNGIVVGSVFEQQ
jgi:uncharacterized membrane protein (UPF0127 family)